MHKPGSPEAWRERWKTEETKRPPCYNRNDFTDHPSISSYDINQRWITKWFSGCAHWKQGGNAYVRSHNNGLKGETFKWSACNGCRQKDR